MFPLHVLTATSPFYEGMCESLIIPTVDGRYGVLSGHSDTICAVVPGELYIRLPSGEMRVAACAAGIMKVEKGDVLVLVDWMFSSSSTPPSAPKTSIKTAPAAWRTTQGSSFCRSRASKNTTPRRRALHARSPAFRCAKNISENEYGPRFQTAGLFFTARFQ